MAWSKRPCSTTSFLTAWSKRQCSTTSLLTAWAKTGPEGAGKRRDDDKMGSGGYSRDSSYPCGGVVQILGSARWWGGTFGAWLGARLRGPGRSSRPQPP